MPVCPAEIDVRCLFICDAPFCWFLRCSAFLSHLANRCLGHASSPRLLSDVLQQELALLKPPGLYPAIPLQLLRLFCLELQLGEIEALGPVSHPVGVEPLEGVHAL